MFIGYLFIMTHKERLEYMLSSCVVRVLLSYVGLSEFITHKLPLHINVMRLTVLLMIFLVFRLFHTNVWVLAKVPVRKRECGC